MTTATKKAPSIRAMFTEVGHLHDGRPIVVGWEFCKSGHHVANCTCQGGPTEPEYITKMREREATAPAQAVTTSVSSATSGSSSTTASAGATKAVPSSKKGPKLPSCSSCGKPVTDDDADKNDDGTWTCFSCQEGS